MLLTIKAWRKTRGLTQARVAAEVGITPSTLSRYETGRRAIPMATFVALAAFLQVPLDLLYVDDLDPDPDALVPAVWAPLEPHALPEEPAGHLTAWLREQLGLAQHLDPDKALSDQYVYQLAQMFTLVSRFLWELVAQHLDRERQERHALRRAFNQTP
jgi:transcriptional regulator with XRE-family HTH domain